MSVDAPYDGPVYPLGSETEYALEASFYALSTAAMQRERGREHDFAARMGASIELLLRLETEHGLPHANEYRRRFHNVMRESRLLRAGTPHA